MFFLFFFWGKVFSICLVLFLRFYYTLAFHFYLSISLSRFLSTEMTYVEVEITGKLWNENQKSQVRIFVDIYTSSTIINQHRTHTEKSEPSTTMLTTCFGNEAMRFRCLFNLQLKWETANKFEMRKNRFFRYKFLFSPITFSFFLFLILLDVQIIWCVFVRAIHLLPECKVLCFWLQLSLDFCLSASEWM